MGVIIHSICLNIDILFLRRLQLATLLCFFWWKEDQYIPIVFSAKITSQLFYGAAVWIKGVPWGLNGAQASFLQSLSHRLRRVSNAAMLLETGQRSFEVGASCNPEALIQDLYF